MVCLLLFVVQRADIERDRAHVAKIYKEDSMFNPLLQCPARGREAGRGNSLPNFRSKVSHLLRILGLNQQFSCFGIDFVFLFQ